MSLTQKTKKLCNYICPPEGLENTPSKKFQDLQFRNWLLDPVSKMKDKIDGIEA